MSAICECCEHPIQGPPAIDSEGNDFCAPCIASLMGAEVERLREQRSAWQEERGQFANDLIKIGVLADRYAEALRQIVAEFDNGRGGVEEDDPVVQIALSALHPLAPRLTGEERS